MARVTLLKPRTYVHLGKTYTKGKPEIVADDLGKYLRETGHFAVSFAFDIENPVASKSKPSKVPDNPRQIVADIKLAMGRLEEGNKAHFTAEGKPHAKALTELVGYPVTAKMRDDALEQELTMEDPVGQLLAAEAAKPKTEKVETTEEVKTDKGVMIKIIKRRKPTGADKGPAEKAEPEDDPNQPLDTGDGVEV